MDTRKTLRVLLGHVCDQIYDASGVTHLVVVPRHELHDENAAQGGTPTRASLRRGGGVWSQIEGRGDQSKSNPVGQQQQARTHVGPRYFGTTAKGPAGKTHKNIKRTYPHGVLWGLTKRSWFEDRLHPWI